VPEAPKPGPGRRAAYSSGTGPASAPSGVPGPTATPPAVSPSAVKTKQTKRTHSDWTPTEWNVIGGAIRLADPAAVTDAFIRIMPNFATGKWVTGQHAVAQKPRKMREKAPHSHQLTADIAEYAAASTPLHLADAWTYFGRAMGALSAGSIDVAQHLLYYSELRAMHSLLFRHGVVLMNGMNFALAAPSSQPIPFPKDANGIAANSHQAIWILFNQWIKSPVGSQFCGETVLLAGQPLSRWADERPLPMPLGAAMQPLMQRWGVDMERFARDRQLRNDVSYNPTGLLRGVTGVNPSFVADLFQQVWRLLEPDAQNVFQGLDRHVARIAFDVFSQNDPGDSSITIPAEHTTMNQYWVDKVLGSGQGKFIADFLDDEASVPTAQIIANAGKDLHGRPLAEEFSGMLGRALILLRFATGAVSDLLTQAGCPASRLEFWLSEMLTSHGIRMPDDDMYLDLWAEIETAIDDITDLESNTKADDVAVIREDHAGPFATLSGFERVPAWAVA
jgi:hypothetical protein